MQNTPFPAAADRLGTTTDGLRDVARRVGAPLVPERPGVDRQALDPDGFLATAAFLVGRRTFGICAGALATACAAVASGRSDAVSGLSFVKVICGSRSEPWRLALFGVPEQATPPAETLLVEDLLNEARDLAGLDR